MQLDTQLDNKKVALSQKNINGELFYMISNNDIMRPFFMSIVSDSDHWMFISSNGGLTAGRKNAEFSLFPYYTDDKITEDFETTGSKTIFQVEHNGETKIWEPFSNRYKNQYSITRNLYKSAYGNKVLFEEVNETLSLIFTYQWSFSDTYGFLKSSTVTNTGDLKNSFKVLDGIQNLMPHGVGADLQGIRSNLVDAYKRSELVHNTGLGIYALSAIIVDRAEPSEALKANTVWSCGLDYPTYLVSSQQLDNFREQLEVHQEIDVKAERGAYFITADLTLESNETKDWYFVANVNQGPANVANLNESLKNKKELLKKVKQDINLGTDRLLELASASDGIQLSADKRRNTRHFSNTLFNIMRGGIFDNSYQIEKWDFDAYLLKANRKVHRKQEDVLANLPNEFSLIELHNIAHASDDKNFRRLCLEYMPLKFSRRHGDPSRPWNKFSINTRNEDGSKVLDYEGNWRDIFQNWEALAHAYPEFIESMIHKFLNATTFDGYNPYRVTKDGFDWETIEPHDPWSYIGYWGDHQIIYLLKFLEFIQNYHPEKLAEYFTKDVFVYANVPYKIKSYQDILKNPKDTITFDEELDAKIRRERNELGADGALLRDENRFIVKVNFIEKILATTLAKISNFIPEAGIWLNTQRPEWNDANNALVGNGVSMVTLYYLHRFFNFFDSIISDEKSQDFHVSKELVEFFNQTVETLKKYKGLLDTSISNTDRKSVLDGLGEAGSTYRNQVYTHAFSGRKGVVSSSNLKEFIGITLDYLKHAINANKRADNLYHAYNLMTVESDTEVSVSYLDEMLEGQVAALSSGYLKAKESLAVLDAMKHSKLFRHDQYSYLLYPNKELPKFTEKNIIPETSVSSSKLLLRLLKDGNTDILVKDIVGTHHFNGNFNNASVLEKALNNLPHYYSSDVEEEKEKILQIFEDVFNHKAFTGRSGTFFGYEGLGSIYWHMVSKLLVAVQETCVRAHNDKESDVIIGKLLEHYYEINEGIGVHKSPELYGAFPTDPYSHTPLGKGAQQPGMTGQVKEDILTRIGELGVFVHQGKVEFTPFLLRQDEFLKTPKSFEYINLNQEKKTIQLYRHELAFTYCQVPIVYAMASENSVEVYFSDKSSKTFTGLALDAETSKKLFERTNQVENIKVNIVKTLLK